MEEVERALKDSHRHTHSDGGFTGEEFYDDKYVRELHRVVEGALIAGANPMHIHQLISRKARKDLGDDRNLWDNCSYLLDALFTGKCATTDISPPSTCSVAALDRHKCTSRQASQHLRRKLRRPQEEPSAWPSGMLRMDSSILVDGQSPLHYVISISCPPPLVTSHHGFGAKVTLLEFIK